MKAAVTLGLLQLVGAFTLIAQDAVYVTKTGSFDPDGSASKPYHLIESGIARALSTSATTLRIGPGKYYETFTVDRPLTFEASGETVTIGKLDYQSSTTLELVSLNTHLCGDVHFCPFWEDWQRGEDISFFIRDELSKSPDVIGFQEIWDDDIFLGDEGDPEGEGIRKRAEYPYGEHGTEIYCGGCWNSGLAIMSRHRMENWSQHWWKPDPFAPGFCSGSDCWASKGWVQTEIRKEGFEIWIMNLHTDAGESLADRQARKNQLTRLRNYLLVMRLLPDYRSHAFFVMGDFNVYDHKDQYRKFLVNLLGDEEAGGRDADRNSPGFILNSSAQDTHSRDNPLVLHWDQEAESGRLDYIVYFPSADGSVEVLPLDVDVRHFTGREIPACVVGEFPACSEWRLTNQSSDHWSVHGQFKLIRK